MSTAVAKIAFLQGQAWAKAPDGTLRALTVGSTLNDDDILVTAQGSRVELDVGNGEPLIVNGGLEVGMSRDFLADTATETDEALLSDASVQEALTVLEQGGDLLDELEETAAGDNTGGGSDGNSSFVRLARVVEGTGSQLFGFDPQGTNASTVANNEGDYINRAPLVTDQTLASNEDEVLIGQIIASDIEGDTMTYALTSAPANGTLLLDPITGQFSFTPNTNYNGSDSFVVTVTDSRGNASSTTISLNILPVNDAPTTNDINLTTDEDIPVSGQVVAEDIEGDTLTYSISGQPANGSVVLDPATGAFVYTPNPDYNGSDVFIVTVDDGNGGTTISTVRIGINPVNDAPVSSDQNLVTDEDTPIDGQVVATDVDGDTLGYSVSGQPTNGVVVLNPATGGFTYSPNANYNGSDSFVVTISDGNGGTTTSRINIGINPVNDAPESADQNLTTPEDTPLNGQVVATDVENDTLAYAVSGQPTNGSVTLNPATGEFVYTPNANYNGSDSFVVTIDDGNGGTTTSLINIGVTPVNDAPVSSNLNLTTPEDTPISSQISASDVDGDSLTFTVTGAPGNGSVSLNPVTGSFTYSPSLNYNGSDSFVVTISDGNGGTTTSLVSIGVTPVNDAPTAANLNLTTDEGVPVNGAISANDPDGDTLSYTVTGSPANGTVVLNPATGTFTYTPNAAFNGSDNFVVRVSDGNGGVTTSTVNIGVAPAPATTVSSIDSPSITEGGDLEFTVTLSGPAVSGTSFAYSLGGGSAVAADYGTATFSDGVTLVGGDLIIPTGVTSFTVTVPTVNDVISESTETLPLSVGGVTGTGSILDNDPAPKIFSIGVFHATEGADLVCTVTFDQVLAAPYSLSYNIGGGTASLADYGTPMFNNGVTIVGGNLLIPDGINSFTITLPTVDDTINEPTERVPFTFGSLTLNGNIYDNDAAPSINIDSINVNEADGTATFTVTLSAASGQAISVDYASSNGSAIAGSDYSAVSGTLNFAPGETSKTITVNIADDSLFENSENFTVTLSNPSNVVLGTAVGTATIVDNDGAPSVSSVSSPSITEGGNLEYTVTLSGVSATETSLAYSLGGGDAVAADIGTPIFSDGVTLVGGNLLIPAGVTNFTVTVPTVDDALNESTESLPLTIGGVTGTGSILDNDGAPSLSINSISVNESAGTATFTVTLSVASGQAISVDYASVNGSATAGSDYAAVSGTLNFAAGETTKTITVSITDDNLFEGSENFTINLSNPSNAVLGTATGTGTIVDNDSAPTVSSISSPSVTEGGDLVYSVALSNPSTVVTSLAYSLGGGSAVAADIGTSTFSNGVTLVGGNLLIPAGVTTFTVTVATVDDVITESTEALPLTIGGVTGTGSIIDNDGVPTVASVSSPSTTEGGDLVFDVVLSNPSASAIDLAYSLGGGSAVAADYSSVSFSDGVILAGGILTIPAGVTNFTVTVATVDDALNEATETLPLSIGGVTGTGSILDNDGTPSLSINSVSVNESAGTATFTVTLSAASGQAISVDYVSANGSATAGSDYAAVSGTLNFAAGEISKTITVNVTNDGLFEGNENFTITLSNPGNATLGTAIGTGTIVDVNSAPETNAVNATGDEDSLLSITLSGSDSDGSVAGFVIKSLPANGVLYSDALKTSAITLGDLVASPVYFMPNSDWNGSTSFSYASRDNASLEDATPATVSININPVADPAILDTGTGSVKEDISAQSSATGTLSVIDPDAGEAGFQVQSNSVGTYGTFSINALGVWTYNIDNSLAVVQALKEGETKTEQFTVASIDGTTTTVTITVIGTNDGPTAVPDTATVNQNSALTLTSAQLLVNDTDPDGDTLSIASVQDAINGSVAILGGDVVFTPTSGYFGPASFTYTISDGQGGTSTATVNVTVNKINTAPVANDDAAASTSTGNIGLMSEYFGYQEPADGNNLTSIGQVYSFISGRSPDATFVAKSFDYSANTFTNGLGTGTNLQTFLGSDAASLTADPATTTDAIIRMRGFVELGAGAYNFKVLGDDGYQIRVDGVVVAERNLNQSPTTTTHSQFLLSTGGMHSIEIVYWDQAGSAKLKLELSDDAGVTYDILSSIPNYQSTVFSAVEDTPLSLSAASLLSNDVDIDGDVLTIQSVQGAINGTVSLLAGNIVFIPAANYNGPASFTYTISDGKGGTDTAIVNLSVVPVNDAPVAVNDTLVVAPDRVTAIPAATLLANDTDADGDALTIVSVQGATNGAVSLVNGEVRFTPTANYEGAASFTYTLRDPRGLTSTATANLTVAGAIAPSVVLNKSIVINAQGALGATVDFPIITRLVDTDGSETLSIRVSGVPTGATFSAGTNVGSGVWSFTQADLSNLKLSVPGNYSINSYGLVLTVAVTSTEATNNSTATTSSTVRLFADYTTTSLTTTENGNTTGTSADDFIQGGSGNNTISGAAGNDLLYGGAGNDIIHGDAGEDVIYGQADNDTIYGGIGSDRISGGAGDDILSGGSFSDTAADTTADVFVWSLGDQGAAGAPAVDTINYFGAGAATANTSGDILDLRDLLQGESVGPANGAGNLADYLHFEVSGGNTTIHISHTGGFSADSHTVGAGYTGSAETQKIILTGVDLQGLYSGATTDQQIITQLLNNNKLITD